MKIILSRKGFDSSYGGVPSPILPGGRMVSLPIPERPGMATPGTRRTYAQIQGGGQGLGRLVRDLTRGKVLANTPAHLDPDINPSSVPRPSGWMPMFGQTGAAETHLRNQGVGPGDLFLFFGWFREVMPNALKRWQCRPGAPDGHVLFGWLQIAEHIDVALEAGRATLPTWAAGHPHNKPTPYGNVDCIYLAADRLRWPGLESANLPGGGIFDAYHPRLRLSAPGLTRSWWRLPTWFHPSGGRPPLTYHPPERWALHEDHTLLDTAKQGQEFVLDCDHCPEALPWVAGLFGITEV